MRPGWATYSNVGGNTTPIRDKIDPVYEATDCGAFPASGTR